MLLLREGSRAIRRPASTCDGDSWAASSRRRDVKRILARPQRLASAGDGLRSSQKRAASQAGKAGVPGQACAGLSARRPDSVETISARSGETGAVALQDSHRLARDAGPAPSLGLAEAGIVCAGGCAARPRPATPAVGCMGLPSAVLRAIFRRATSCTSGLPGESRGPAREGACGSPGQSDRSSRAL